MTKPRKENNQFKKLTTNEIQEAFNIQKSNWNFYNEREFIENLFNQRFNYLILMYSLFLTALTMVKTKENQVILMILGTVFSLLIGLNLYRAFIKLDILLKILHHLDKDQVFPVIQKEVDELGWKALFSVNSITGVVIPLICFLTFLAGLILSLCDILKFY